MPDDIVVGNRTIGEGHPGYFVAEAGVNHNGDLDVALELIEVAARANADAVKFQKRTNEDILTREALDAPYVKDSSYGATYGEHRAALEFGLEEYEALVKHADRFEITLLASAWDPRSVDFVDDLGCPAFKTASADLTNLPLLKYTAAKQKPMFISTGMASMEEVQEALEAVRAINRQIVLLQCTSSYPSENSEINLRVMDTYREQFGVLVGYSGHERGLAPTIAAAARGAVVIERHFTLDRTGRGPDHAASLEPSGLTRVIRDIRNVEAALGRPEKKMLESERSVRERLAKSLTAAADIAIGQTISESDLTVKGPGTGLSPRHFESLIGVKAETAIEKDSLIPQEALEWKAG